MDKKITQPIEIVLVNNGETYTAENLNWDLSGEELLTAFKRLMVAAGYPPSILSDEYGEWKWVGNDNDNVIE